MTAVYVAGGILLFLLWLLSRRVHIGIGFDGAFFAYASFLFLRIDLTRYISGGKEAPEQAGEPVEREVKPKEKEIPVKQILSLIKTTLSKLIKLFGRSLWLERFNIKLLVATGDAAETAVLYGVSSAAVASVTCLAENLRHRRCDDKNIKSRCECDFVGDKCDFLAEVRVAIRLFRLFSIISILYSAYKNYRNLTNTEKEKRKWKKTSLLSK